MSDVIAKSPLLKFSNSLTIPIQVEIFSSLTSVRIHVLVSENRSARLRHDYVRIYRGQTLRRTEKLEILSCRRTATKALFYERLTNQILDDMVAAMKPRYIKVTADFTPRGGLHSKIVAQYVAPEWSGEGGCGCGCGGE